MASEADLVRLNSLIVTTLSEGCEHYYLLSVDPSMTFKSGRKLKRLVLQYEQ